MNSLDALINKGIIFNGDAHERGRTFIVTGLQRSGTSLVSAVLQHAGIFMGSDITDAVYEDQAIVRILGAGDIDALRRLIAERNATHAVWGFKHPQLSGVLRPEELQLFDRPRVIVTFRDPLAIAVRTQLSEYAEPMQALADTVANQAALIALVSALRCPSLLLSYEKALSFPAEFIAALLQFCGIPGNDALRARLQALVEPNRPSYLMRARRRYDGLIEGVRDGQLYGWCCLTRSTDPITLDIMVDDRLALTVTADSFRQDLLEAGIGEGRHGYFIPVEALQARPDSLIRVVVARHRVELANSGTRLCDFGSAAA